jgi:hypothetical protein
MESDMKPREHEPTYEELHKQFIERLYSDYYLRSPDSVVLIPVSPRVAAAVRANPVSVRVSVRTVEGVHLLEAPKLRNRAGIEVRVGEAKEVDQDGFPVWYEEIA